MYSSSLFIAEFKKEHKLSAANVTFGFLVEGLDSPSFLKNDLTFSH